MPPKIPQIAYTPNNSHFPLTHLPRPHPLRKNSKIQNSKPQKIVLTYIAGKHSEYPLGPRVLIKDTDSSLLINHWNTYP